MNCADGVKIHLPQYFQLLSIDNDNYHLRFFFGYKTDLPRPIMKPTKKYIVFTSIII